MQHMVRNDELKERLFGSDYPNLVIYSCQFDDVHMVEHVDFLRLGADGMEVWVYPCYSCLQQITSFVIEPLIIESTKQIASQKLKSILKKNQEPHPLIRPFAWK